MILKTSIVISVIILIIISAYLFIYYFQLRTLRIASQYLNEQIEIYGRTNARQMTVDWLKKQLIVKDAGISDNGTIWIEFITGIEADISIYPSGTL